MSADKQSGKPGNINSLLGFLAQRSYLSDILLPALTILFGLQTLRMLIPGLTWLLGDRFGLDAVQLGVIALVIFGAAFLAGALRILKCYRRAIVLTAGGLALMRLCLQLWWGDPLLNLIFSMLGTVCFVLFLATFLDWVRIRGRHAVQYFIIGLVLGLLFDTAIHGAFASYDMVWQADLIPILIILSLILVQFLFLAGILLTIDLDAFGTVTGAATKSYAWLAIGPFLFLELVVFCNIARLSALTGWSFPLAFGWIILGQLVSLLTITWLFKRGFKKGFLPLFVSGLVLIISTSFANPQQAWLAALTQFLGQLSSFLLLVFILFAISQRIKDDRFSSIIVPNGIGMVLLAIFLLGYYAVYQISLPYDNTILEPIAGLILALCALVSYKSIGQSVKMRFRALLVPMLASALLILPLAGIASCQEPEAETGNGFPVRIMTYNLHNGFNTDGYLDIEALATIIEQSDPDIVALQEISRGWLISGRLDMLFWLSQRLDMHYVSGPTADPFWGNAILSRYPIVEYNNYELPTRDLFILRGFTEAIIDIGGQNLRIIATHYHHLEDDSAIRRQQSSAIASFWNGSGNTIILGDFNAEADSPEMLILLEAGLADAAAIIQSPDNYTFRSDDLYQRIDYILLSPDLMAEQTFIPQSQASDHLAVIADINRRN